MKKPLYILFRHLAPLIEQAGESIFVSLLLIRQLAQKRGSSVHGAPSSDSHGKDRAFRREPGPGAEYFSLCSNCHNQIHYGTREDVRRIISLLFKKRQREIGSILGRDITLEEIYQIYHVL